METSYNFLGESSAENAPAEGARRYKKLDHLQSTFTKIQPEAKKKESSKPLMLLESHELLDLQHVFRNLYA